MKTNLSRFHIVRLRDDPAIPCKYVASAMMKCMDAFCVAPSVDSVEHHF